MRRRISIIVMVAMVATCFAVLPGGAVYGKTCKKDGFYTFLGGSGAVKCKVTKNSLTVKKGKGSTMEFDDSYFTDGTSGKKLKSNCKFKLAKKIYVWETEFPANKVNKFGTSFYVSKGKYVSRKAFAKKKNRSAVAAYIVVKNGKLVGWGNSAGAINA